MAAKRCLDVTLALVLSAAALPIVVLAAIAVWLESGRPILFRQERVGRNFRRFDILKLRTMTSGEGPMVTVHGDTRVTRVGALLRASKLDELPQLWNVLRGDMSLVGPRPEVPKYVDLYRDRYRQVLAVRPGITDSASVRFRNEESVLAAYDDPVAAYAACILPMKLDLAEQYVATRTLRGDLGILIRTAVSLLIR